MTPIIINLDEGDHLLPVIAQVSLDAAGSSQALYNDLKGRHFLPLGGATIMQI